MQATRDKGFNVNPKILELHTYVSQEVMDQLDAIYTKCYQPDGARALRQCFNMMGPLKQSLEALNLYQKYLAKVSTKLVVLSLSTEAQDALVSEDLQALGLTCATKRLETLFFPLYSKINLPLPTASMLNESPFEKFFKYYKYSSTSLMALRICWTSLWRFSLTAYLNSSLRAKLLYSIIIPSQSAVVGLSMVHSTHSKQHLLSGVCLWTVVHQVPCCRNFGQVLLIEVEGFQRLLQWPHHVEALTEGTSSIRLVALSVDGIKLVHHLLRDISVQL